MPYFIYYVTTNPANNTKSLEYIDTQEKYKEARALAREKRSEMEAGATRECRMIFAKNKVEAEKLLSAPREERIIGED
jgi:F0F1-type ATP synthase membrane subunit b/b'